MTLVKGYGTKNRPCDAESIHVDEEPPTIYFDPEDSTIGTNDLCLLCSKTKLTLIQISVTLEQRPKAQPEQRIMERPFYEALKKRKIMEQEMKAVISDLMT